VALQAVEQQSVLSEQRAPSGRQLAVSGGGGVSMAASIDASATGGAGQAASAAPAITKPKEARSTRR
jgi:hypothetical protein